MTSLAWAFFKRDAMTAMSYRVSFALKIVNIVLVLGVFFYIGQTVGETELPALKPYGGNYLAFLLIGVALTECVVTSLVGFADQIREGQLSGSLEATLMSPVPLPLILVYSSLWSYFFNALRFVVYIVLAVIVYGVDIAWTNVIPAMAIFILTVLCFVGVGMLWASVVLLMKRGRPVIQIGVFVVVFLSGVLFPTGMLPGWLKWCANLVPLTHALDGMRGALLQNKGFVELSGELTILIAFAVVFLAIGVGAFEWAVKTAKRTSSLTEF